MPSGHFYGMMLVALNDIANKRTSQVANPLAISINGSTKDLEMKRCGTTVMWYCGGAVSLSPFRLDFHTDQIDH